MAGTAQQAQLKWHSSGWAAAFTRSAFGSLFQRTNSATQGWDGKGAPKEPRPQPEQQERKEERRARVVRVKIFPGDVRIQTGEQVIFTAIAYDRDGAPVSGVDLSWDGLDEDSAAPLTVSPKATFISAKPRNFKLTVDAAGRKDQVKVTVTGIERTTPLTSVPGATISSSDKPKPTPTPVKTSQRAPLGGSRQPNGSHLLARRSLKAAVAPLAAATAWQANPYDYTWNGNNYGTSDDPGTERGDVPGHAVDGGAGSGNFQFSAPLLGLDGRGIDLNLAFTHNSRLWHKAGSEVYFDIDRDWIPGWSLGFGKIVVAGDSYILIDGDGTRHPYTGVPRGNFGGQAGSLQTYEAHTTDGSFIDYYAEGYKTQHSGGYILKAWAKLPNGTSIDYGASALGTGKTGAIYPTQITDANGNYITITYRNNQGPEIETINDSLGRAIQFHYDASNLLTAITAPGILVCDSQG